MTKKTATKIAPEFTRTREFIRRFVKLDDDALDVVTVWTMGTWAFSPASPASPATYPYLYVAGAKGSGKTVLGQDVMGVLCRNHQATVGATGASLFRMIGEIDEETGEVTSTAPTLSMDEIDATFNGPKNEASEKNLLAHVTPAITRR